MLQNEGFWIFSEKSRFSMHVATWHLLLFTSKFFWVCNKAIESLFHTLHPCPRAIQEVETT